MKFFNPVKIFGSGLSKKIAPKEFLKTCVKHNMIDSITDDYGNDIYSLCRNASTWLIFHINDFCDATVIDGLFNGRPHTWVRMGDYYLDLTLAQFGDYPAFSIISVHDVHHEYQPEMEYQFDEWLSVIKEECF